MSRSNRRRFLWTAAGAAALGPTLPGQLAAQTETGSTGSGGQPFRIFMITWRGWEDGSQGFKDYLERRRIPVELIVRDAERSKDNVVRFVDEAKATRPDLVYTWGTTTALTTFGKVGHVDPEQHITDIPSVFNIVTEPVGNGLVTALDQPRANLTGTLYLVPVPTQFRTMETYGEFERVGIVYNPLEANSSLTVQLCAELCAGRGCELIARPAALDADGKADPDSIPDLVRDVHAEGAEWLYVPPDSFLNVNRDRLTDAATDVGLPSFAGAENFIRKSQGLVGLVSRYYNVGQFAGYLAEQILVERRAPSEIPIQNLNRFSLLINMATAHRLRFYPPMSMLAIAEFV